MTGLPAAGAAARVLHRQQRRRLAISLGLTALLLAVALHALARGSYPLDGAAVLEALVAGPGATDTAAHVLWSIRLPRLLAATLAGLGLAVAGAAMQSVLHNPLASPLTLGVSQGAAFGATCAIVLLGAGELHRVGPELVTVQRPSLVVLAALAGGLGSAAAILAIATLRALRPEALVLAGIALGAFSSAGTMLVQYFAADTQVAASVFWTFGDLGKAGWPEVAMLAAALLPGFALLQGAASRLNALAWGGG